MTEIYESVPIALIGSLFIAIFYFRKGYFCIILNTAIKNSLVYSFPSDRVVFNHYSTCEYFTGQEVLLTLEFYRTFDFFTGHDRRSDGVWLGLLSEVCQGIFSISFHFRAKRGQSSWGRGIQIHIIWKTFYF